MVGTRMSTFGLELRRRREAAGFSLAKLARNVHYDKGYLSRLENGHRLPSVPLARTLDAALDADGALAALAPSSTPPPEPPARPPHYVAPNSAPDRTDVDRAELLASVNATLDVARTLGRTTKAAPLLQTVAGLTNVVLGSLGTDERDRPLHRLAARCAEFAGWMAQESGAWSGAQEWTALAAKLGADDSTFVAYTSVRRAEIALYTGQHDDALRWAADAEENAGSDSRVRALALFREAQGHAALGSGRRSRRALDRGAALYENGPSAFGSTSGFDQYAAATGWCYHDLGRHAESAELLAGVVRKLPARSRRIRAVFGARLSAAQAAAGEREAAGVVCRRVLSEVSHTASASALTQLDEVQGHLRRWRGHVPSQRLALDLTAALQRRPAAEACPAPVV